VTSRLCRALVAGACLLASGCSRPSDPAPAASASERWVGASACVECHAREDRLWRDSFHALAMQPATPATVAGAFDDATFVYNGVTSTFSKRGDAFVMRTDGPDGVLRDYPVTWTFGARPLQQYVVAFPRGWFQLPSVAWDARPAEQGGQRWYHLYPGEQVDHRDALHWTGPAQNWNYMCAECHSTNVQKRYAAETDTYDTTFSEVNVSCEACHGPGGAHVDWGRRVKAGQPSADPRMGLVFQLKTHKDGWPFLPGTSIARRVTPIDSRVEVETCGRCHARRSQDWADYRFGAPLADTHRVSLIDEGLYESDGQQLDEVYEYGSFLQSRMYLRGVTCTNCHDPHSGRLLAPGNELCSRCHLGTTYDTRAHHFHKPNTDAALCTSCHMPARTYMGVDARRDHAFRLPRPDESVRIGTSNACTTPCHAKRPAAWAAAAVAKWYGPKAAARPSFAPALDAGRRQLAGAGAQLRAVLEEPSIFAPIVRASALSLLASVDPRTASALLPSASKDPDPLVRRAAAESLEVLAVAERARVGGALLADSVRTVRLAAASTLAGLPREAWHPGHAARFDTALAELRASLAVSAERGESWVTLGSLEARLGNGPAAEAAYRRAIRKQPQFVPSYVNLADLYQHAGREAEAESALRQALRAAPETAMARHALGLALVRQRRMPEALAELARAVALAPRDTRYAYVFAVALHDTGSPRRARQVLEDAYRRSPGNREVLEALLAYSHEAGDRARALQWARALAALDPADAESAARVTALESRR
jgi:predicted CXXCH cytochrome family protein